MANGKQKIEITLFNLNDILTFYLPNRNDACMDTLIARQKSDALESRCLQFAKQIREFLYLFSQQSLNFDERDQIKRSSGSIGANYIEARGAFSKADFLYRIKICRKEARETAYWIELLFSQKPYCDAPICKHLKKEIQELISIFTSIAQTTEARHIAKNRKSENANRKS